MSFLSRFGFAHGFIAGQAKKLLLPFFDEIGEGRLTDAVRHDHPLKNYVSDDGKQKYKDMARPYKGMVKDFTNEEVYGWIPDKYHNLLEKLPGGRAWGLRQIVWIRAFILE